MQNVIFFGERSRLMTNFNVKFKPIEETCSLKLIDLAVEVNICCVNVILANYRFVISTYRDLFFCKEYDSS